MFRMVKNWQVGDYTISQHEHNGQELYAFTLTDGDQIHEYYDSLDMALIAMVGEKYTGRRGAGGEGVGTAADWFARMIGLKVV